MYDFLVNYDSIDKLNILKIHKYLIVKNKTKECSVLLSNCLFAIDFLVNL